MADYRQMTDEQIKDALRDICRRSNTDQEVKDKIATELNFKGAAVTHSTSKCGRMTMWGVMMYNSQGDIISI